MDMKTPPRFEFNRPQPTITWLVKVGLIALFVFGSMQTWAVGIIVPRRPVDAPVEPGKTAIYVQIVNNLARSRIHQEFFNPNPRPVEADFVFPLPKEANVTDFVLYVNGKPQRGEVLESEKARSIYEDIVRRMRDPGLLEWVDWNLFRVAIFPIPPNSSQTIEIEFSQPLRAEQGVYQYLFPLAGPETRRPPRIIGGEVRKTGAKERLPVEFAVKIEGDHALGNVYSPTHKIEMKRVSDSHVAVEIPLDDQSDWRRNFVLYYDYRDKDVAATLVAHRHPPDAGYFCLTFSPSTSKAATGASTVPLDLIIILDTSGSMAEDGKIDQARRAVNYCLAQLQEEDRFALVRFATDTETYAPEFTEARKDEIARAQDWVRQLRASGGTNIGEALEQAAKVILKNKEKDTTSSRRCLVLFITDGLPTVGVTSVDELLQKAEKVVRNADTRIFTFGVGYDVNTRLLDQLAERTRACAEYVAPREDLEVPVARLFDKVARPALTALEVHFEGGDVFDIYPKKLPDLFYGTQLTVFGRYKRTGPALIRLKGNFAGEPVQYDYEKTFPDTADNEAVERLWATRKVGYLLDQYRANPHSDEIRDEIISLAKRYGIVTPLTSFLVIEDKAEGEPVRPPVQTRGTGPTMDRSGTVGRHPRGPIKQSEEMAMRALPGMSQSMPAESGQRGVAASKAMRMMKEASVGGQVAPSVAEVSCIAGRCFHKRGEVWMEEGTEDAQEILRIRAYSPAYFDLLRRHREIRKFLEIGENIRLKVRELVVEISPTSGIEELPEVLKK
ncbi:MAG: VIT and VWA domain-containing protein [Candidatus Sumerlaeaceae bacterium]|nr:VIT and VWA domain-containing protein [Candidatus Sumerlaeaceae bacterium]